MDQAEGHVPGTSSGGEVAAGYEPVRTVFEDSLALFGRGGGGFAAYVDGVKVVDVWGGFAAPGTPWRRDTLAVVMSATKGMATLCAQILNDRGLLDVEATVASIWPEFAHNGKERILVRHVLTHTSGVLGFGAHRPPLQWDGTGWDDYDAIAAGFAAAPALWEPGTRFGYHALSYGWLVGEMVRRITGSTIGTFFHHQVAQPLGLGCFIGTPPERQSDVASLVVDLAREAPLVLRLFLGPAQRKMRDPRTLLGQAFVADGTASVMDHGPELFNSGHLVGVEVPAGNGTAAARDLARMYAVMSMNGALDGVRVLSEDSVERFARQQIAMRDVCLDEIALPGLRRRMSPVVRRTLGYLMNPSFPGSSHTFGPNLDSYGHDGAGGQIAFCDRENRVAVGFVRSASSSSSKFSDRLIAALYECAGRGEGHQARRRRAVAR
ncbi:MAG TPA: serine hydrolase domain-containing protein [Acidimicrobiales bacterium]|nr:serine hydrolase domain-containing protein [Acidimicrobiales bacterium]